jgi:hypothetical protein
MSLWSLAVLPVPAWAADAPVKQGTALPLASGSALAGLGFGDKPYILSDSGTFFDTMNRVAAESRRSCGTLESFGWEIDGDVQARVDKLSDSLLGSLHQSKFLVKELKSKLLPDNGMVQAYTAERTDRRLMVMLVLSPPRSRTEKTELVLLICNTTQFK